MKRIVAMFKQCAIINLLKRGNGAKLSEEIKMKFKVKITYAKDNLNISKVVTAETPAKAKKLVADQYGADYVKAIAKALK